MVNEVDGARGWKIVLTLHALGLFLRNVLKEAYTFFAVEVLVRVKGYDLGLLCIVDYTECLILWFAILRFGYGYSNCLF